MKILIIEDSKATAAYLSQIMQKQNYKSYIANSGKAAMQLIQETTFNLVILDLMLPDIDGSDILHYIRKQYKPADLPVIVISASKDEQKIAEVLEYGANDFINKPFTETTLKLKINNLLKLQQTQQALHEKNTSLQIKNKISNAFLLQKTNTFYKTILDIVLDTFNSQFGYFGYIDNNGDLTCPTMSFGIMDKCEIPGKSIVFTKDIWGGIWGESLMHKKALIKNSDLSLPEGHIHLKNAMAVPVLLNEDLIGQITIGNKNTGYTEEDRAELTSICDYIAPLLHSRLKDIRQTEELEQAKQKAEQSEEKFRSLFAASPDAVLLANAETGIIADANEAASELFEMPVENIIGRHHLDIHPEDRAESAKKGFKQRQVEEESSPKEIDIITAHNKRKTVEIKGKKIDIDNKTYILGTFRDITERIKNERQIRMLSSVIEQSPSYVLITDLDGNIEYVNPSFTTITGYTFEEVKGKNPRILKSGKMKQETYKDLWNTITRGGVWRGEFINKRKNGEIYYEKVVISPIKNNNGEIFKYFAIKEDITRQKTTEQKLLRSARIIRATYNSSTDDFLLIDKEYNILAFNKTAAENLKKLWNASVHEGDNIKQYISKKEWTTFKTYIDTAFTGETNEVENEIYFPNESAKWYLIRYQPVYDENNTIFAVSSTATDITERKKTEQALKESENKFRTLFENAQIGIALTRIDGSIVDYNNAMLHIYGLKSNTFPENFTVTDLYADKNERARFLNLLQENGKVSNFETKFKTFSGETIYININSTFIELNNEKLILTTQLDVTANIRAQQALKESEAKLKQAQKIAHMGNWELDIVNNKLYWSDEIYELFGLKPQEFEPTYEGFLKHIHPEDREMVNEAFTKSLKTGEPYEIVHRIQNDTGETKYVKEKSSTDFDEHGNPMRSVGIVIDITNQKLAEIKEQENKKRFRLLAQTALDFHKMADETGIYRYMGLKLLEMYPGILVLISGIDKASDKITIQQLYGLEQFLPENLVKTAHEQFKGMVHHSSKITSLFRPGYLQESPNATHKVIQQFTPESVAQELQEKEPFKTTYFIGLSIDDQLKAGLTIFSPRTLHTESHGFIKTFVHQAANALEIQLKEQKILEAKNQAERADKVKSDFIANMSHEFRTPLNAILGFSEILKSKIGENNSQRHYIDGIFKSGQSLLNLINDILDLSKIEAGRVEINPTPTYFKTLLDEIKQIFSVKANHKSLEFPISIPPDFPEIISIDESRMRQILFNLTGNAIKFTERGFVSISIDDLNYEANSNYINFSIVIKDSGIGIEPDKLDEIFEPFRQQKDQDLSKYEGTGLGLSITKRLVEAMNGTLSADSEPGEGSEFRVYLSNIPVAKRKPKQEEEFNENIAFNYAKILIANNSEKEREILKHYLSEYDFDIIEANDVNEVLLNVKQNTPDVIIMDLILTETDHKSAINTLTKNKTFNNIPIICITKKEHNEEITGLCTETLKKPILKKALIKVISYYIPYREKQETPVSEANLDDILKHKDDLSPAFITEIKNAMEQFQNARRYLEIEELLNTAEKMQTVAQNYEIPSLEIFGKELKEAADNFDIDKISELFKTFKKFINKLN